MSSRRYANPKKGEPIRLVLTSSGAPRYRVVLDIAPQGAKRQQLTRTFHSLEQARNFVTQTHADMSRGTFTAPSRATFADLGKEYLRRVGRGDHGRKPVRPATLAGYQHALDRVSALIGTRPVSSLTYTDLADVVDKLAASYSVKSVRLSLTISRAVLAFAVREGHAVRNPADGVSPQGKKARERRAYTADQVRSLVTHAQGHRLSGVFALVLLGLRRSEVLGMRWGSVDLENGRVVVERSRTWGAGGYTDHPTKTARGERTVYLDPVTIERLRTMRLTHVEERMALGVGLGAEDVLAAHEDGTPVRPEYLAVEWDRLCKRAEVSNLGLHAARHGQVGVLRAAGVPDRIIAERLGHTETVMRDTYGLPFAGEQDRAAEVMATIYGEAT